MTSTYFSAQAKHEQVPQVFVVLCAEYQFRPSVTISCTNTYAFNMRARYFLANPGMILS